MQPTACINQRRATKKQQHFGISEKYRRAIIKSDKNRTRDEKKRT